MTPRKPARAPSAPQEAPNRRRDDLETLRSALLAAIADVRENAGAEKQAQLAPLTARLLDTLNALDKLPKAQQSTLDELRDRRKNAAARTSGAPVPPRRSRVVASRPAGDRAGGKRGADPGPVAGTGNARSARRGA